MASSIVLLLLFTTFAATQSTFTKRQSCGGQFDVCAPSGANSQTLPEVGPLLKDLYTDIIQAVDASGLAIISVAGPAKRQDATTSFCCAENSDCLLLTNYMVPFCWDRFTTNFIFPDGSYGSVVAGNYSSASGITVDLIYGTYKTADGQVGNIYEDTPSERPDTSTMVMPMPFTSSGTGSAIPASELGTMSILSTPTDRPEATLTAITLPSLTISVGPTACTRCLNHSATATATEGNMTSEGHPSIIFPPINAGWKSPSPLLDQYFLPTLFTFVIVFHTM